jgi:acetyl-CoA C-acetyltransferase
MKETTDKVVILSAVRTPVGKFGGAFKGTPAVSLATTAAVEAMTRAGVPPDRIDETVFGMARQAGNGPNPARQAAVRSGIPVDRPAFTVNKACASGMKAITLACQSLLLGENRIVLTGGMENMSRIPYLLDGARWGYRLGHGELVDAMYRDGLFCPLAEKIMGETAETLAGRYGIGRREQDEFALASQMKAKAAAEQGKFKEEIVPVTARGGGRDVLVTADEHARPDTTLEKLAKLPPVFKEDGTVTAGNSSGLTDGAAALVLTTRAEAKRLGARPLAEVLGFASAAVDPGEMGLGPVPAVKKLLGSLGLALGDFDLVEINEAFAAQVLACERELAWDTSKRNVCGGAIALGHPIGCTGAKITVTLLHSLIREGKELGLAALCVSGGQGMALAIKRI